MRLKTNTIRCLWILLGVGICSIGLTMFANLNPTPTSGWAANRIAFAQSEQVRFANIGDFGLAGRGEEAVANLVKSWQPEFIVTNGDDNYQQGSAATIDKNIGQYYHDYIFPYVG